MNKFLQKAWYGLMLCSILTTSMVFTGGPGYEEPVDVSSGDTTPRLTAEQEAELQREHSLTSTRATDLSRQSSGTLSEDEPTKIEQPQKEGVRLFKFGTEGENEAGDEDEPKLAPETDDIQALKNQFVRFKSSPNPAEKSLAAVSLLSANSGALLATAPEINAAYIAKIRSLNSQIQEIQERRSGRRSGNVEEYDNDDQNIYNLRTLIEDLKTAKDYLLDQIKTENTLSSFDIIDDKEFEPTTRTSTTISNAEQQGFANKRQALSILFDARNKFLRAQTPEQELAAAQEFLSSSAKPLTTQAEILAAYEAKFSSLPSAADVIENIVESTNRIAVISALGQARDLLLAEVSKPIKTTGITLQEAIKTYFDTTLALRLTPADKINLAKTALGLSDNANPTVQDVLAAYRKQEEGLSTNAKANLLKITETLVEQVERQKAEDAKIASEYDMPTAQEAAEFQAAQLTAQRAELQKQIPTLSATLVEKLTPKNIDRITGALEHFDQKQKNTFIQNLNILAEEKEFTKDEDFTTDKVIQAALDDAGKDIGKIDLTPVKNGMNAVARWWSKKGWFTTEHTIESIQLTIQHALEGDASATEELKNLDTAKLKSLSLADKKQILKTLQASANKNRQEITLSLGSKIADQNLNLAQRTLFSRQQTAAEINFKEKCNDIINSFNPMMSDGQEIVSIWARDNLNLQVNLVDFNSFKFNPTQNFDEQLERLVIEQKLERPKMKTTAGEDKPGNGTVEQFNAALKAKMVTYYGEQEVVKLLRQFNFDQDQEVFISNQQLTKSFKSTFKADIESLDPEIQTWINDNVERLIQNERKDISYDIFRDPLDANAYVPDSFKNIPAN